MTTTVANTLPIRTSHCTVGGVTTCGATLLRLSLELFTRSLLSRMQLMLMSCMTAKFARKSWHIFETRNFDNYAYIAYLWIYLTIIVSMIDSKRMESLSRMSSSSTTDCLPLLTIFFGIFHLSVPNKRMQYARGPICQRLRRRCLKGLTKSLWSTRMKGHARRSKQLTAGWKQWLAAWDPSARCRVRVRVCGGCGGGCAWRS